MNDFKIRIIAIGLQYKKVAELLEVSQRHLCNVLNDNVGLSEEKKVRLDYILTQYENITL